MLTTSAKRFTGLLATMLAAPLCFGISQLLEAEKGQLHQATVVSHEQASGGKLVRLDGFPRLLSIPAPAEAPHLSLTFTVKEERTWKLSLTYHAPGGGSDSCYWSLDDRPVAGLHVAAAKELKTVSLGTVSLKPGNHTLRFWQRERSFGIDCLRLEEKTLRPQAPKLRYLTYLFASDAMPLDPTQAVPVTKHEPRWHDGIALKPGVTPFEKPTVVMPLQNFGPGEYTVYISARTAALNRQNLLVQFDDCPLRRRRVIFYSGNVFTCDMQRLKLTKPLHHLKLFLPEGMEFYQLKLVPFRTPKEPAACKNYKPKTVPGPHPRLLITPERLREIRSQLSHPQNQKAWRQIVDLAKSDYVMKASPYGIDVIDSQVFSFIQSKSFYYLLTKDKAVGLSAIATARRYLEAVDPGIQEEYTRPVGRLIYSSAMAYDWCYDLLTEEDKTSMRTHMLQLASKIEIGWPPFKQPILVGHGNECQLSQNLLAMAIAIYDEDPEPYRICAYRVFEELVPGQTFVYASGRHDQGTAYGGRHFFDLFAAWHMKRLGAGDIFSGALREVPYFWTYAGTPDGKLLPRGDDYADFGIGNYMIPWFSAMYHRDPVQLGEYYRRNVLTASPVMWLLFNDSSLQPQFDRSFLPLVKAFSDPLGGMSIRTGWNEGRKADDLVVDLAGMDLHFANHHHLDGGAFQIYYKGLLTCDLGMYWYYGTPYDMKYNKRGIPHNILLLKGTKAGDPPDGGAFRRGWNGPATLKQQQDDFYRLGRTSGQSFGPDAKLPVYATMRCDLSKGFQGRAEAYVRNFVFHNFNDPQRPGMLVILDRMTGLRADVKPYFLLNSLTEPKLQGNRIQQGTPDGGRLLAEFLLPQKLQSQLIPGGTHVDVFGKSYPVPYNRKQAHGFRTMVTPQELSAEQAFLSVMQIHDQYQQPLMASLIPHAVFHVVGVRDTLTLLPKKLHAVDQAFSLTVPEGPVRRTVIADVTPGFWHLRSGEKALGSLQAEKGVLYAELPAGTYEFLPGRQGDLIAYGTKAVPTPPPPKQVVMLDGKKLPQVAPLQVGKEYHLFVPLKALCQAMNMAFKEDSQTLTVDGVTLKAGQHGVIKRDDGEFLVPNLYAAGVLGLSVYEDRPNGSVWYATTKTKPVALFAQVSAGNAQILLEKVNGQDTDGVNFSANGRNVICTVALRRPLNMKGLALAWNQGTARKAFFKLEVSADHATFKTVFDGASSGQTNELETVPFKAQTVNAFRLTLKGNSRNSWNVITNIGIITE